MPHYDLMCSHCQHHEEVFQRMTQWEEMDCPKCGHKMKRQIGPGAGVIFKGSGWIDKELKRESNKRN